MVGHLPGPDKVPNCKAKRDTDDYEENQHPPIIALPRGSVSRDGFDKTARKSGFRPECTRPSLTSRPLSKVWA